MSKRILITGITGFVGSHMADFILAQQDAGQASELFGTRRWHLSRMDNIAHIEDRIEWMDCNLVDPIGTREMIAAVRPDVIFHFASESFVSPSWSNPSQYMSVNYNATVNLLDALRQIDSECLVHIPGSGEEYGEVSEDELPITEETVLRPVNPYAVSKIAQDLIGFTYFKSYGTRVIRTRAFNHEGPRRDKVFGIPWYAYQVARIEAGLQDPVLEVGHLDDRRNFTHVKDMVRAYWMAVESCEPGTLYTVGSDEEESVFSFREALEMLIQSSTADGITYRQNPRYVRPTQVPRLICDTSKFRAKTGWKPELSFQVVLADTLEYWREKVGRR